MPIRKPTKLAEKQEETETVIDKKADIGNGLLSSTFKGASHILNMDRTVIPLSPGLTAALGGMLSGGMLCVSGRPKIGKTSILLYIARECQKVENGGRYWNEKAAAKRGDRPGRPVLYVNVEGRITKRDLLSSGLDLSEDKFMMLSSDEKKTMYAEDFIIEVEKAIDMYPGIVIIIDSIGSFCSKRIGEVDDAAQVRDPTPMLVSQSLRRWGQSLMPKDIIMLNVLHKVANPGARPGQATTQVTGGNKILYAANYILHATWYQDLPADENDKSPGRVIHLECEASEVGPPDIKSDCIFMYEKGLWASYELILLTTAASTNGLFGITKRTSVFDFDPTVTGGKDVIKARGINAAAEWLDEHPQVYRTIYDKYAEMYWTNLSLYKQH